MRVSLNCSKVLLVVASSLLLFTTACGEDEVGERACEVDEDCPDGYICDSEECTDPSDEDDCEAPEQQCGDECVDTSVDDDHCGQCASECGADQTCVGGDCVCDEATVECDDGCVDPASDDDNCGACGVECPTGTTCQQGGCVDDCPDGEIRCGGECVDTDDHDDHCGQCDSPCSTDVSDGESVCQDGSCVDVCSSPDDQTLCQEDGVCVDVQESDDHCGECDRSCGSRESCQDGECRCGDGYSECVDGECTDTSADHDHCGECGQSCADVEVCADGECVDDCPDGQQNCDGGCVDLSSNQDHCGTCNNQCATDVDGAFSYCDGGSCTQQCATAGQTICEDYDQCANLSLDDEHCGECGNNCETDVDGAFGYCDGDSCAEACTVSEQTICDDIDQCVNLQTDDDHCGACGDQCETDVDGAFTYCSGGDCVEECADPEQTLCEDAGVCVDTDDNDDYCGDCQTDCGADESCVDGTCIEDDPCDDGEKFCSSDDSCVDVQTDDDHCGECDNACGSDETCQNGSCSSEPTGECDTDGSPFGGGTGSVAEPYMVCTAAHLANIDDDEYLDDHFEQHANIDLADVQPFTVIGGEYESGDWTEVFSGVYDGNGFQIADLELHEPGSEHVGLFGGVDDGDIREVTLTGVDVLGGESVGGLVGRSDDGWIEDSSVAGTVVGDENVGGIVGDNYFGSTVESCESSGHIEVTDTWDGEGAGGIAGVNRSAVTGSTSSAVVEGFSRIGGIVGNQHVSSSCEFEDNHATGTVTLGTTDDWMAHEYVGGLIGLTSAVSGECDIADSTSSATVDAPDASEVGGLVGRLGSAQNEIVDSGATGNVHGQNNTGGLVGESVANYNPIRRSYATGDVEGSHRTGGLIGLLEESRIFDSYATGDVDGLEGVGGLVGRLEYDGFQSAVNDSYALGDVGGDDMVGGFVGDGADGSIVRAYSFGDVDSDGSSVGAFVGGIDATSAGDSYYNEDNTSVGETTGGITALDSGQFTDELEFDDWSFDEIWQMGSERPVHQWDTD